MSFGDHFADIGRKCLPKLRAFKAIAGQNFVQKHTNFIIIKQYYRPTIEYSSTAILPLLSETQISKLQVYQNNSLRAAIGSTRTTSIEHLHREIKVLKIKDHIDMLGAQFYNKVRNDPTHTLHHTLHTVPPHRNIRKTPATYYSNILNTIPLPPPDTNSKTHIHNTLATRYIAPLGTNTVLGTIPPELDASEATLSREVQVHLSRFRCGQHNALMAYRNRLHPETPNTCPLCHASTQHITLCRSAKRSQVTTLRHSYTPAYIGGAGLLAQDR